MPQPHLIACVDKVQRVHVHHLATSLTLQEIGARWSRDGRFSAMKFAFKVEHCVIIHSIDCASGDSLSEGNGASALGCAALEGIAAFWTVGREGAFDTRAPRSIQAERRRARFNVTAAPRRTIRLSSRACRRRALQILAGCSKKSTRSRGSARRPNPIRDAFN